MHKKKLINACGVVAIAVVVGAGASYYSQHSAKNEPEVETEAEKPELTEEETAEMLDDNFSNMESAEISMSSTTRWLTGSEGTADGDGVVNTDAVPDGTEEQTTELPGGQAADTYDESTVSATAQFSGKNAHGQWTSQTGDTAETNGEFYMSEADGAITEYSKAADAAWSKAENAENVVSGTDYMLNFTYDKLEDVKVDQNDDGTYTVHASMPYAEAMQVVALATGNAVSISDDDFTGATTAVEIQLNADKKAVNMQMDTENTEKMDVNADGKIAESSSVTITFSQDADVSASLLTDEIRQNIETEIQAAADAAAAEAAQEQENAAVEESSGESESNNSGSSGNSSSKKSSSSGSKSSNSESGSSSSDAGSGNYVYGQDTPGVESTITIGDDRPSDYGQTPSTAPDPNQVGDGSWESEGKPDYVDKEFAGGYVPDNYTPGQP